MPNQNTQVAQPKTTAVTQVKAMLDKDNVKKRFQEVLGKKAPMFMASIVNCVSASTQLKQADPTSIMASAFEAASYDLPIDSNLGFAAIVPYNKSYKDANGRWQKKPCAQFQMMYKGFIQLAIRSGQYAKMNCSEVYEDELKEYNPITGECSFVDDFTQTSQRNNGESEKIVGYYAWFELNSGFRKELYMSKAQVQNHAMKYSQSYRSDQNYNKQGSRWTTDFDAMGKKTVIKLLLSKWGILSIDMQRAITDDQKVYDEDNGEYADNQPDPEQVTDPFDKSEQPAAIDAETRPVEQPVEQPVAQPTAQPTQKAQPVPEEFNDDVIDMDDFDAGELPFK